MIFLVYYSVDASVAMPISINTAHCQSLRIVALYIVGCSLLRELRKQRSKGGTASAMSSIEPRQKAAAGVSDYVGVRYISSMGICCIVL